MAKYDPLLNLDDDDLYADYEAQFDPMRSDRQARRKRKQKANHKPKKSQQDILGEVADTMGLEGGFQTTYVPGLFEEGWLLDSIRQFYDMALITDVLGRVNGGKEASVYRCAGHPSTGQELLAVKVYRPRMFRNLRNDKMYREGRAMLTTDGREVKERDKRLRKAVDKNTGLGQQMAHTSWLMYEYTTLQKLHAVGAAVPQPFSSSENAILMSYIGDETRGAPRLSDIDLPQDEAREIFHEVLRNIELMLEAGLIHGDLSPYNILYHEGKITLIDFPQVTLRESNSQARMILQRDIQRVCDYFAGLGVHADAHFTFKRLQRKFLATDERGIQADMSRYEIRDADD